MNQSIKPNLTNAEKFSVEEDIAKLNDSQTNDTAPVNKINSLFQKGDAVKDDGGTIDPTHPVKEFSSKLIV
ncbi:MAG: hypothetical protein RMX96_04030 [Nostoc sp. ChiSLP02]|nr:hypothetical protein [Nostoc sp. DedSLP05]MDZ8098169.1 hypothetical protein [Nostoc sp. DedSLP01]MDZ8184016.1 hypothetical protein [Nostoc sp. ChiSLP02]